MTLARSGWALSLADGHDAAAGRGQVLPGHLSATLAFATDDDRAVNTNFRTF